MLGLFRNNQSTTVFLLALYIGVLHLPAMLGWVTPVGPLTHSGGLLFHQLFDWAAVNPKASAISAALLVFLQALLVNSLADTFRMMPDRNWFPGALYALASSAVPAFHFISPELVAVTFLPVAFRNSFRVYKKTVAFGSIFNSAFWITVAVLFYPPAVLCLPAAFAAQFNLRSFSTREQMVFLTGVFVPFFLALTGFFWHDQASEYLQRQFTAWMGFPALELPQNAYGWLRIGVLGALLAVALMGFNIYYFKQLIQVQKYITILYWFLFAGILASIFQPEPRPEYFLLTMPTLGIFLSFWFQSSRNTFMIEFFHLALLVAVFGMQFFPR
ncbi:MAG: hypothetical protein EP344_02280 [Bacteroidetes bacterium]|nr:MAG: hypothetical protein EP344_02280 [Bacteroidota bacterium]